jgi:hypothetical protein
LRREDLYCKIVIIRWKASPDCGGRIQDCDYSVGGSLRKLNCRLRSTFSNNIQEAPRPQFPSTFIYVLNISQHSSPALFYIIKNKKPSPVSACCACNIIHSELAIIFMGFYGYNLSVQTFLQHISYRTMKQLSPKSDNIFLFVLLFFTITLRPKFLHLVKSCLD